MIKYYIVLTAICFSLFSCSKDSKHEPVSPPEVIDPNYTETPLEVNPDNFVGEWEIYYYEKQVNELNPFRYIDWDGARIIFEKQVNGNTKTYTFKEYNQKGDLTKKGTYSTGNGELIMFRDDTVGTVKVGITHMADKRFILMDSYVDETGGFKVKDKKKYRNVKLIPGQHPDVKKYDLTPEIIKGKWQLFFVEAYLNNRRWVEKEEMVKKSFGSSTVYNADAGHTFYEENNFGDLLIEGTYRIVDDVVFTFYKEPKFDEHGQPIKDEHGNIITEDVISASSEWVEKKENIGKPDETLVIFEHSMTRQNLDKSPSIAQITTKKKKIG